MCEFQTCPQPPVARRVLNGATFHALPDLMRSVKVRNACPLGVQEGHVGDAVLLLQPPEQACVQSGETLAVT